MRNEKEKTRPKVDIDTLNRLLANKQKADDRYKKAMLHRATYKEDIELKDDDGNQNQRVICIVKKGNQTTRLLAYAQAVVDANKALLEAAPEYFDAKSNMFKEPTIVDGARKVTITVNKAASSRLVTGATISKLLRSRKRNNTVKLQHELTEEERDNLEKEQITIDKELAYFEDKQEMRIRRRSQEHRDVMALCFMPITGKAGKTKPADKIHVNAGGLIIIRHRSCDDSDINIVDNTTATGRYSIYDEANPIETVLAESVSFYDESELELIRQARAENRGKNVTKARSQFDGLIN
tara:strand:- start:5958 stop:6842 length:885 start_codon:yes stop_codon:yes gene_type:complete